MIEIVKATGDDLQTIHDMAQVVFRHTYRDILSPEQMEYMMDMMYSLPNLQTQLDEGHHYYIAYMSPDQESSTHQEDTSPHEDGAPCRCNDLASSDDSASAVCNPRDSILPVPCGYVSVQHEGPDQDGTEIFHLHKIYVMPEAQGSGVGMRLFQTVVQHVKSVLQARSAGDGASAIITPEVATAQSATAKARIELNVNKFNSAVNFYKHLGMRILLEEDFPIGNGFYKTDYIMGLDI